MFAITATYVAFYVVFSVLWYGSPVVVTRCDYL